MQAAGAALVQGASDALQQGSQTQQQFQQGAGAPGGQPGAMEGTGGQMEDPNAGGQPQQSGLSGLIQNKTNQAVTSAMTPQVGGAMQGVSELNMGQEMANLVPSQSSTLSPDILQMLRQRGMVL